MVDVKSREIEHLIEAEAVLSVALMDFDGGDSSCLIW